MYAHYAGAHNTATQYFADAQGNEDELTIVIVQALPLLQGASFLHKPSKVYLGRKGSLEVSSRNTLM